MTPDLFPAAGRLHCPETVTSGEKHNDNEAET
jgi:hypothetical protein